MKTLLISFALYIFSGTSINFIKNPMITDDIETIDKIKIKADVVTFCKETKGIASMKEKAKSFDKSIVLYKAGSKWVVERDSKKRINAIELYSGTEMAAWQGNLKLENVVLSDETQIVALN